MANLQTLQINDTGSLTLPSGTAAGRPTISTVVATFTAVGSTTWTVPAGITEVEVLVVAGGGGGGRYGGGGGGGGVIYNPNYPVTAGQVISITVGGGGAGHPGDAQNGGTATQGGNSIFGQLVAIGGGGGGNYNNNIGAGINASTGGAGGSGGGNGSNGNATVGVLLQNLGGAPTLGQGHRGGIQSLGYANGGGGGGGAGGGGGNGQPGGPGGLGGVGLEFNISGTYTYYGGGGGGSAGSMTSGQSNVDLYTVRGGLGGGGRGLPPGYTGTTTVADGTANTGGGGGGGCDNVISGSTRAGNGGSGIVIVKYSTTAAGSLTLEAQGLTRFNTENRTVENFNGNIWRPLVNGEHIVRNGLVLYYDARAYSGSGTTLLDLSGRNNHGTLNGSPAHFTSEGGYFNFDGSNDYIEVPTAAWPTGRQHTAEFWIKGTANIVSSLMEVRDSGDNRIFNLHLTWVDSRVYYDTSNATRIERAVPAGEYFGWHHWVAVLDTYVPTPNISTQANGLMRIYRDGKLYHQGYSTFNNNISAPVRFRIGSYATASPGTYHQGPISQVRVYNRALGIDEIKRNYEAGRGRYGALSPAIVGLRGSPGSSPDTAAPNARIIKEQTGTEENGFYWIKPGNLEPIWVYCDMKYDNGGWTLVGANVRAGQVTGAGGTNGIGPLTYHQSINNVWYNGSVSYGSPGVSNFTASGNLANVQRLKFRVWVGLKYWTGLGLNVAQFCSTDAVTLCQTASHTKRYRWSYGGFNNSWGFLSIADGGNDGSGAGSPGLYSYHAANSFSWTSFDNDQDTSGGNCATSYGNLPWWYGACWSGSLWGSGTSASHLDAPYWDGSGADVHNYMAIYLKANPL